MDRSGTTSVSVVPDDTNVNNLSRSLHRDTLKFSETVLKLGGCVGGLQFYQTFIQKQLITSSVVILVLGFFFPIYKIDCFNQCQMLQYDQKEEQKVELCLFGKECS